MRRRLKKTQWMFGVKKMKLKKEEKRKQKKAWFQGELRLSHPISCLHPKRRKEKKIPKRAASTSKSFAWLRL